MKLTFFWIIGLILSSACSSWAFVEVKMTYTGIMSNPNKSLLYNGTGTLPEASATSGLGADIVFTLPFAGMGFGVRYENLGMNYKNSGLEFDGSATRTSAILSWRWVDDLVYFGPLLTYGISHSGGLIKVTENTTTIADLTSKNQSSYSAGLELGGKLLGFRIGIEAGYMNYLWKNLSGTSGSITSVNKIDLSGSYGKFIIGFGI